MTLIKTPRKLLMTATSSEGNFKFALVLIKSLLTYNVEVHLALLNGNLSRRKKSLISGLPGLNIYHSRVSSEEIYQSWANINNTGKWLMGLEMEIEPDVVHLNHCAHGAMPFLAPTIVNCHSSFFDPDDKSLKGENNIYRKMVYEGLSGADMLVTDKWIILEKLKKNFGSFPHTRIISSINLDGFENGYKYYNLYSLLLNPHLAGKPKKKSVTNLSKTQSLACIKMDYHEKATFEHRILR